MRTVLLTVVLMLTASVAWSAFPWLDIGSAPCSPACDAGVPCINGHCFGTGGGGGQSATCCNNGDGPPPGKR